MTQPPYDTGPGPGTPPGFAPPPGQASWEPGHPLAAARDATRRRFLAVMAFFAVLLVVSVAGFVLTAGDDVKDTAARVGDAFGRQFTAAPKPTQAVVEPPRLGRVPEPVTYRGRGDRTLRIRRPEAGPALVYVKGTGGSGLFSVTGERSDGTPSGFVVATLGAYEGVRLLDVAAVLRTARLKIDAVGPWTVEVRSARAARSFGRAISGTGDTVVRYTGPAGVARVRGGAASSAFTVTAYGANGFPEPVVISVGAFDGRRDWPAGPALVEVKAAGRWSIRVA